MADLRDSPLPSGYRPNTPNQFREKTVDDCTWFAMEYAYERASLGQLKANPVDVRRTVDPDLTGPTRMSDAFEAFDRYYKRSRLVRHYQSPLTPRDFDEALNLLRMDATLVVIGDYEELPFHYRRWTYNDKFDHAIAIHDFRPDIKFGARSVGSTYMYDPLGGGRTFEPYDGEWIPVEGVLRSFVWTTGTSISIGVLSPAKEEQLINSTLPPVLRRLAKLKAGTHVLSEPTAAATTITKLDGETDLGLVGAVRGTDWRAVQVMRKIGNVVGYVHSTNVLSVGLNPLYTPTQGETLELVATLEKANADLNQRLATIAAASSRIKDANTEIESAIGG